MDDDDELLEGHRFPIKLLGNMMCPFTLRVWLRRCITIICLEITIQVTGVFRRTF